MKVTHAPTDTRAALERLALSQSSRSLYFDRFAQPELEKDARRKYFSDGFGCHKSPAKLESWREWLLNGLDLEPSDLIFARLQSRLMVNMAGGVMENAGLCLDRFGMPYIPGSAVKGCGRRLPLAALREWCEANSKPTGNDDVFTPACQAFSSPDQMLVAAANVFGWVEQDWKEDSDKEDSDFAWACGNQREALWTQVAECLCQQCGWTIPDKFEKTPWKALPSFAGSVCFLPAYPVDLGRAIKLGNREVPSPELGKLELDVVTCHHRVYYQGDENYRDAPDTEEPNPVVFPALAAGHVFVFAVLPGRNCSTQLLNAARTWVVKGLETFGLGAKTGAGYGWFDCSDTIRRSVGDLVSKLREKRRVEGANAEEERQKARAAAEAERLERERLAEIPKHEQHKAEYLNLQDEPFAGVAKKFGELDEDQKRGFVLALKERRDTAKRWAKKKPELIKPWQEFAKTLKPPVELP